MPMLGTHRVDGSAVNWRSAPLTPPYVRVSYTAVHNPSFQSLFTPIETISYFMNRLQIFLGIGHPSNEIDAPILISERIMFSPSSLVRPMQIIATRFLEVLRLRLTSPPSHPVAMEISPGKDIFFPLIPAGSTTSVFISKEMFRTSQWCACSSNLAASYPVPVRQYQGL